MKSIKLILCIFLVSTLYISCTDKILIKTDPSKAMVEIDGKIKKSPCKVSIKPSSKIKISADGYMEQTLTGESILKEGLESVFIELTPSQYKLTFASFSTVGLKVFANGELLEAPFLLPKGQFTLKFESDKYFIEDIDIQLSKDTDIQLESKRKYQFINPPENILRFIVDETEYAIEDAFTISEDEDHTYTTPTSITFLTEEEAVEINITSREYRTGEIDLTKKFNSSLFLPNQYNKSISIEGSWILPIDSKESLRSLEYVPTGFERPFEGNDETNKIVRNPEYFLPSVTILNPLENIIGSTVIVTMQTEVKHYEITEKFYRENLTEVSCHNSSNLEEPIKKRDALYVDNYIFDAPYNNRTIHVQLVKNNEILDEAKLTSGKDKNITRLFGNYDYHVYNTIRNSFFHEEKSGNHSVKYLYIDPSRSGQYLIIYKREENEFRPIQAYQLGQIGPNPAIINILDKSDAIYDVLVAKDLSEISDWAIFSFMTLKKENR